MSGKNGFTLVELMVVIVIMGILAAMAIPRIKAETAKAKAVEGPMFLSTIAKLQEGIFAEYSVYILVKSSDGADMRKASWQTLGMDANSDGELPSNYFRFIINGDEVEELKTPKAWRGRVRAANTFNAFAELKSDLGEAKKGESIAIDNEGVKYGNPLNTKLKLLVAAFMEGSL